MSTRTAEEIAVAAEQLAAHLDRIDAGDAETGRMSRPSPEIAALGHAAVARDAARDAVHEAERAVEAAVLAARRNRHSWGEVALALGVKRQSAHKRYGHLEQTASARA
ncbi:hypothetical protein BH23ACT9_BH23ACT9_39840 [soil metagenome]